MRYASKGVVVKIRERGTIIEKMDGRGKEIAKLASSDMETDRGTKTKASIYEYHREGGNIQGVTSPISV